MCTAARPASRRRKGNATSKEKTRIYRLTIAEYKREIELAKTPEQLATLLKNVEIKDGEVIIRR